MNNDVIDGSWCAESAILTVAMRSIGPICMLTLRGALSGASIAALEAQIDQIGASDSNVVLLDLVGLHRLDEVGRRVLVGLDQYVQALGGRLIVMGADGQVAETLADMPFDFEGRHDSLVDLLLSDLDREVWRAEQWSGIDQHKEA